jgi:uncharacterized protein YegL
MSSNADLEGESVGLCVLDIVKHALKTVVNTLLPEDRVAIVPFSSDARVELPFTHADEAGKAAATAALDGLHPGGGTYMWRGIETALGDQLMSERPTTVLLLTDGCPSDRDHARLLQEKLALREQTEAPPVVLSTFGFGYSLDSALLDQLARIGGGQYSFIPDIGLVGTVFVHSCANLLCRMAPSCRVLLDVEQGGISQVHQDPVLRVGQQIESTVDNESWFPVVVESVVPLIVNHNGTSYNHEEVEYHVRVPDGDGAKGQPSLAIELGLLQYGQPRGTLVHLDEAALASKLTARVLVPGFAVAEASHRFEISEEGLEPFVLERCRGELIAAIAAARSNPDGSGEALKAAAQRMRDAGAEDFDTTEAYLEDIEGQVAQAIARTDWFARWGRHYLPSLQRAHELQQCNNFKDPGVQGYGGKAFGAVRDHADDVFLKIPAPKPSQAPRYNGYPTASSNYTNAPSAPVDMSRYLDRCGGCFASGDVLLADGTRKAIQHVAAGDRVRVRGGEDVVQCVVEMRFAEGVCPQMVDLGAGVVVTPWHPVRANGAWTFPADLAAPRPQRVEAVYSLVLETQGAFTIGQWDAVGLGHGFSDGAAAHAYFASREAVLGDLRRMRGFAAGRVVLGADCMLRGPDGLVCGLDAAAELPELTDLVRGASAELVSAQLEMALANQLQLELALTEALAQGGEGVQIEHLGQMRRQLLDGAVAAVCA